MERSEGLKITQIEECVHLTSVQARTYVADLVKKGLINITAKGNAYHTTPKGVQYLTTVNTITGMLRKKRT